MTESKGTLRLLEILNDPEPLTRDEMAEYYREFLEDLDVDWSAVNTAIMQRWSRTGLSYIKRRAWGVEPL